MRCDLCKKAIKQEDKNNKQGKLYPVDIGADELVGLCFNCVSAIVNTFGVKKKTVPKPVKKPTKKETVEEMESEENPLLGEVDKLKKEKLPESLEYSPKPKRLEDDYFDDYL